MKGLFLHPIPRKGKSMVQVARVIIVLEIYKLDIGLKL